MDAEKGDNRIPQVTQLVGEPCGHGLSLKMPSRANGSWLLWSCVRSCTTVAFARAVWADFGLLERTYWFEHGHWLNCNRRSKSSSTIHRPGVYGVDNMTGFLFNLHSFSKLCRIK